MFPILVSHKRFFFFFEWANESRKEKLGILFTQKKVVERPRVLPQTSHTWLLICCLASLLQVSSQDCRFSSLASPPSSGSLTPWSGTCSTQAERASTFHTDHLYHWCSEFGGYWYWHTDISVHCSRFQLTLAGSNFSLLPTLHIHFSYQTILWFFIIS